MDLILIPAYNEEETVGCVVKAVRAVVDVPVVVVDDGSTDATPAAASQAGATVLGSNVRLGYGAAMVRGFAWALQCGARAVATIDADGQHDPHALPAFLETARSYDIVSGTRYHASSTQVGLVPPERLRINQEITAWLNARTGWHLTDAFCGFKAYRAEALRALRLTEKGYAFPLQLWVQAAAAGLSVTELPVGNIYFATRRGFGGGLDDPVARRAYYFDVLEREMAAANK